MSVIKKKGTSYFILVARFLSMYILNTYQKIYIFCMISSGLYFCSLCLQALDTFNTAVVSPIYYVMFTSFTILASVIMFKVCPTADRGFFIWYNVIKRIVICLKIVHSTLHYGILWMRNVLKGERQASWFC